MTKASRLIDVWDAETFDDELSVRLANEALLIRNHMTTDHQIFLAHDLGRDPQKFPTRPENPYSCAFVTLKEAIGNMMQSRTIRAWHYTRLTAAEVDNLRREGIHLSTPATLRTRLDLLIAADVLGTQFADTIYAESPFHSDQLQARSGKFWMVSHPLAVEHHGVVPLMARWGGEVAAFWTKDPALLAVLAAIGRPRIVELAVPLELTPHSFSAAGAIIATFGRSLGCVPDKHCFDLYVTTPLGAESVLRIHSEGDSQFHVIGVSYPQDYVDVEIGYWRQLTGEDY